MNILMTNTGPWGTGSFTAIDAILYHLNRLGHRAQVLFPDNGLPSLDYDKYYGAPEAYQIWRFPITNDKAQLDTFPLMIPDPHPRNPDPCFFKHLSKTQLDLYRENFKQQLMEALDRLQPDIIEVNHIWLMGDVVRQLGLPYVCVAHHSDQLAYAHNPKLRETAEAVAEGAKAVFAISSYVKKEVESIYSLPSEDVIFMPNGFDSRVFYPRQLPREKLLEHFKINVPEDVVFISFSGKLSLTKGVDTLLKAKKILSKYPQIHFLILGAGELDAFYDSATMDLEGVHLLGHLPPEEVALAHALSKINVMPSRSEGFGLACIEAMGCGLPMVVTRCGGPEEYAVGEQVDVDHAQQLAEAILHLVNLPEGQYQALSQQALSVAQDYDWSALIHKRLAQYKKIRS